MPTTSVRARSKKNKQLIAAQKATAQMDEMARVRAEARIKLLNKFQEMEAAEAKKKGPLDTTVRRLPRAKLPRDQFDSSSDYESACESEPERVAQDTKGSRSEGRGNSKKPLSKVSEEQGGKSQIREQGSPKESAPQKGETFPTEGAQQGTFLLNSNAPEFVPKRCQEHDPPPPSKIPPARWTKTKAEARADENKAGTADRSSISVLFGGMAASLALDRDTVADAPSRWVPPPLLEHIRQPPGLEDYTLQDRYTGMNRF
eukprot:gnl/TRDRNA2_/TRDRNA2_164866_c1_seq1.p1 gnl/TRDRNA2_/TRDRNA2_164866_c1~~gnl/TRDRNA2_/TRDRNA2_164866_c1_seq1.p1  ORF type:complete len:259 (-),score=45.97 gnl/TRDRNA2_/TRDRNA2_164866_c1_seq1:267-1043(-)